MQIDRLSAILKMKLHGFKKFKGLVYRLTICTIENVHIVDSGPKRSLAP